MRHSSHGADPRQVESPTKVRPYSAIPHDLLEDSRLRDLDCRLAGILLRFAGPRDHCWPAVATLATKLGRSRRTIQESLGRLRAARWIEFETTDRNATGRIIVLTWRVTDRAAPARQTAQPPLPQAAPKEDVTVEDPANKNLEDFSRRERQTINAAPPDLGSTRAPAAPRRRLKGLGLDRADIPRLLDSNDPVLVAEAMRLLAPAPVMVSRPAPTSLPDLLDRIRECPSHVAQAAEWLARELKDPKSWRGYEAVCRRAWEGTISPRVLIEALTAAQTGHVRRPGAVFMTVVKRARSG